MPRTPVVISLALAAMLLAAAAALPRPACAGEPGAAAGRSAEGIRDALAAWFAMPPAPAREIAPQVLHPDDRSRAIELRGASPNPFRSETAVRFSIPAPARVQVRVFDVRGRLLRTLVDAQLPAGDHSAMIRAEGLPPGIYWVHLRAGAVSISRRLVRLG